MLKKAGAVVVLGHGLIHLMGFVVQFQLAEIEELSYSTSVLGGLLDIGPVGAQALGAAWLIVALVLMAAAMGMIFEASWSRTVLFWATLLSLPVTVLGWPDSQFGVGVNIVILAVLLLTGRRQEAA